MKKTFDQPTRWGRLYAAAALAGVAVGVLVVLRLLPAIPDQVIDWMSRVDRTTAVLVPILFLAVVGVLLTAVAHLGVVLQLRRRSGPRADKP